MKVRIDINNEDVKEVLAEIPEGHRHIRAVVHLNDGTELLLREATLANLTRAYIMLKTHPRKRSVKLTGRKIKSGKPGYAEWQLIEE